MATLVRFAFNEVAVSKVLGDWVLNKDHIVAPYIVSGHYSEQWNHIGGGMRFLNVTIPQGSTIDAAYLTFEANNTDDINIVRSKIVGEATDNAAPLSELADYQARRGTEAGGANNDNRTVAEVLWDNIGAWVWGLDYDSPEIKTVIQEIVDRVGWVSNNNMVLWWDDHAGRSTALHDFTTRFGELRTELHIDFTPPVVKRYFAWII